MEASIVNALKIWARSTVNGQRVLLSIKAAIDVRIAWFLVPRMPGVAEQYS